MNDISDCNGFRIREQGRSRAKLQEMKMMPMKPVEMATSLKTSTKSDLEHDAFEVFCRKLKVFLTKVGPAIRISSNWLVRVLPFSKEFRYRTIYPTGVDQRDVQIQLVYWPGRPFVFVKQCSAFRLESRKS